MEKHITSEEWRENLRALLKAKRQQECQIFNCDDCDEDDERILQTVSSLLLAQQQKFRETLEKVPTGCFAGGESAEKCACPEHEYKRDLLEALSQLDQSQ